MKGLFKSLVEWTTKTGSKMTLLISALLNKHISVLFFLYLALSFFSFSLSLFLLFVCHASFITAGALSVSVWCSFISFSNPHLLSPSPSVLYDLLNTLCFQSCLFFFSLSLPLVACRHLCKSPSCGRRFLWARPFGSLSLCLLEAVLAHLEKQGALIQC